MRLLQLLIVAVVVSLSATTTLSCASSCRLPSTTTVRTLWNSHRRKRLLRSRWVLRIERIGRRKQPRHQSCSLLQFCRGGDSPLDVVATNSSTAAAAPVTTTTTTKKNKKNYNPLSLYAQCMAIVLVWISTGTIFYSLVNKWPLPQSFFYAVDAGMSIGFCTDVAETLLVSKAFTIIFILLGASVVGGALALFSKSTVIQYDLLPSQLWCVVYSSCWCTN